MTISKADAYKFLNRLVERNPDDAVHLLQDIIVDYLLFPHGDNETLATQGMTDIELEVAACMAQGQKIQAVKLVKDRMNMSLKDAKDFVESRSWPESGTKSQKAKEMQLRYVQVVIDKIRLDYNVPEN